MAKRVINSFNAGELSPYLYARSDIDKYGSGCLTMENFVPLPYGGVTRRPALEYKFTADGLARLVTFSFSVSETYLLVFTDLQIKVYQDTTLKDTVVSPWLEAELDDIKFVQSADVMWMTHPSHPVQRLQRNSDTDWTIADVSWKSPPLLDENADDIFFDIEVEAPAWLTSTAYEVGERVINSGTGYVCLEDHTSGTFATDLAANKWVALDSAPADWATATAYVKGDYKTYEGICYVCFYNHTSGTFALDRRRGYWIQSNKGQTGTLRAYTSEIVFDTGKYKWNASGSEDYVSLTPSGDPSLSKPGIVRDQLTGLTLKYNAGGPGTLSAGEWGWGDNDTLGYDTIYVYLAAGAPATEQIVALYEADYFKSGMAGGQFRITGTRNAELGTTDAGGYFSYNTNFSETTISEDQGGGASQTDFTYPIYVGNVNWTFETSGTNWTGRYIVQKSDDYGLSWQDYVLIGDTTAGTNKNFSFSSSAAEPFDRLLRVYFVINGGGSGAYGFSLSIDSIDQDGFVTVDRYIDGATVSVTVNNDVQKDLSVGSIESLTSTSVWSYETKRTKEWAEGAFSDYNGHPCCVALFENRLSFAGTSKNPDRLWMSQTDDYQNFLTGTLDTDAIDLTLNSGTIDEIEWMVPQERLVIGTAGGEWALGASDERKSITPSGFDLKRKTTYGTSGVQGILVNSAVLFPMRQGRKVREWTPNYNLQDFVAPDLTIMSEHITSGGISLWDYQQQPDNILWSIRGDGTLLGFTYERDQNVTGWHRHSNSAFTFESVAVIPSASAEDEVWVSVKMGSSRLIARMNDREWGTAYTTAWQGSDLYKTYSSPGSATLTGLTHLEGKSVVVVADGNPIMDGTSVKTYTVSSGSITIDSASYTYVVVGLPFTSTLAPVYVNSESRYSTSQGSKTGARRAVVRFKDTYSAKVGQTASDNEKVVFDPDQSALYTEDAEVWFDSQSDFLQTCYVIQDEPMPCTVLCMIPIQEVAR